LVFFISNVNHDIEDSFLRKLFIFKKYPCSLSILFGSLT
jgi:hypothetical protein